jgi:hypothetical protein
MEFSSVNVIRTVVLLLVPTQFLFFFLFGPSFLSLFLLFCGKILELLQYILLLFEWGQYNI